MDSFEVREQFALDKRSGAFVRIAPAKGPSTKGRVVELEKRVNELETKIEKLLKQIGGNNALDC